MNDGLVFMWCSRAGSPGQAQSGQFLVPLQMVLMTWETAVTTRGALNPAQRCAPVLPRIAAQPGPRPPPGGGLANDPMDEVCGHCLPCCLRDPLCWVTLGQMSSPPCSPVVVGFTRITQHRTCSSERGETRAATFPDLTTSPLVALF